MYNLRKEEEGREKGRKREGGERERGKEEEGRERKGRREGAIIMSPEDVLSKFPGLLSLLFFSFFLLIYLQ